MQRHLAPFLGCPPIGVEVNDESRARAIKRPANRPSNAARPASHQGNLIFQAVKHKTERRSRCQEELSHAGLANSCYGKVESWMHNDPPPPARPRRFRCIMQTPHEPLRNAPPHRSSSPTLGH